MKSEFKIERRATPRDNRFVPRLVTLARVFFWYADTTTIRLQLALASLVWAFGLLLGPCDGIQCLGAGKGLRNLQAVATLNVWAMMFILHFVGVCWRLIDQRARPRWAIFVNAYGLAIWVYGTISIILGLGRLTAGTSLELVTCFFAAWALCRTGLNEEISTP
jgi:hypothetical protein